MKSFTIKENDKNQRLDKFLQKAVPRLPKTLMYKYIRLKRIKVNGKKSDISYKLCLGDQLELYINDEFFEESSNKDFLLVPSNINVLYEDNNILLVDKKAGLVVHEDNENTIDTLINRALHYLYDKKEYNPDVEASFVPALCNRLDRNTSGIVIIAKNAESLRVLNEKIKERKITKLYLCVVSGHLEKKQDTLTHYHFKNQADNTVKVFDKPNKNTKTMITAYKVLEYSKENTLVEVDLKTGRTHQIRAHMAYIGHPLIGDGKYGSNKTNMKYGQKQQLLYSYKLKFESDINETVLSYLDGKEFEVKQIWFRDEFKDKF
ncbi:RluA family pseudouridine synthase [Paludicola sp. MB14-C6]|uniref:RluA family pseudouridine synthase n=1 Tax=Paludihabitans sp. MB14-C6 TaxID=3070656 RepID=UPI0027DCB1B8|nr:RluA family pseudouridine synthase [Paludicola sp. MB14-C6]WMJ23404.1 RluA family pseudouridine synthase [Paludicola sp. MB14-C6]